MAVGFRKSLLGFNCDDVMTYIEKSHKSFNAKETELNNKISALDNTLSVLNSQLAEITAAKEEVEAQLKQYTDKYDEIERLSQNIGKLYLVAQANSKAIIKDSTDSSELSRKEVERNLSSIDEAHESLDTLKADIMQTSTEFVNRVESLISSLNDTRGQITANTTRTAELKGEFEALYAELTNERV